MRNAPRQNHSGYTLLEMIIALSIIVALLGISVVSFASYLRREDLSSNTVALASALREARTRTLASLKGEQYGVKIDADRFTPFPGPTFSTSTADAPYMFSNAVTVTTAIPFVLFTRLTGDSSASGTIDVYLRTDGSVKKSVQVEGTGLVNII